MSLKNEFDSMISKADFIIAEMAANLYGELIARTPVDTGQLKASWEMTKVSDGWLFSNNMDYASFIFNGIFTVNGRTFGSKKLPDGVYPILQKFDKNLQKRLKALKG